MTAPDADGKMGQAALPPALIIAGPTASGKSALALALAQARNGVVINADAMQCYRDLHILTARPDDADCAAAPHRLYGTCPATKNVTAAWWREAALAEMAAAHNAGQLPILCGGSGMYLNSLINGIASIPEPGAAARATARHLLDDIGPEALHQKLAELDPVTAAHLKQTDRQRIARAYEVILGTGQGLTAWQAQKTAAAPWRFAAILLDPPRDILTTQIASRFTAMLQAGVVTEVQTLLAQNLAPDTPILRAHGVPELTAYLRGDLTLDLAAQKILLATRQYTKRQATWFRHHKLAPDDHQIAIIAHGSHVLEYFEIISAFLDRFLQSPN
jgi:tRNA dimethylallyltransferase